MNSGRCDVDEASCGGSARCYYGGLIEPPNGTIDLDSPYGCIPQVEVAVAGRRRSITEFSGPLFYFILPICFIAFRTSFDPVAVWPK